MSIREEFDYVKGIHKITDEVIIKSRCIMDLQKFDIKFADVKLSIIAIKQNKWTFLYSNRSERWKLLQEIAKGKKIVTTLSRIKNEYGAERIVWNFLIAKALYECNIDAYDYSKKVGISLDLCYYFYDDVDGFFCEDYDFEEYYRCFQMLLPSNIEKARKETILLKYKELAHKYGEQFVNAKEILDLYKNSLSEETLDEKIQENTAEIDYWEDVLNRQIVDSAWVRQYITILLSKREMLEKLFFQISTSSLSTQYGAIAEKKVSFLSQLRNLQFKETLEMFKYFQATFRSLKNEEDNAPFRNEHSLLHNYVNFYQYGSILLSDHLNRINRNKSKRRNIPQTDLNSAMMYFYETDNPENAEQLREKEEYLENKKNGDIGEKEVEYALTWLGLDSSYVIIPKTSKVKYGEKSIVLYKPDFIDEPQEYDHIIIGKQGVFLIETKNYAGKLIIDKNGNWIRMKKEGIQEGERNPIQQLRRHEKLLRSILGKDIPIICIICMAHPKMIIEGVENCSVPLIKSDLLVDYIEKYNTTKDMLTEKEIDYCKCQIEKYMK